MPIATSKRSQSYSRQSSRSSTASGASNSGSLASSGSVVGSSSFLAGRERDRTAEMELFSQSRKPRSTYRRPSNLGLSSNPLNGSSEVKAMFKPQPASRSHIVSPLKDHLKPEGNFVDQTEIKSNYRNLSPARPIIYKLKDTLKPEGDFSKSTETALAYTDKHAQRPFIHRLHDHNAEVQPDGKFDTSSEYRNNFATAPKGERVMPNWISNFEKITVAGDTNRA